MRLIDADALEPHEQLEPMGNGEYEYVEVVYKDDIDDAPTIDAVEVVRCRDCKYRSEYGECDCNSLYMDMEGDTIGVGFVPKKDFYCSYGERREDGE